MNHNILRTSILVLGLAVGIASTAQEARRMHPRQKELTREVSQTANPSEAVLAPRVRGAKGQLSMPLTATPRLRAPQQNSDTSLPTVAGGVIISDTWGDTKQYGVYTLSAAGSKLVVDKAKATDGGVLKDDIFYALQMENDALFGPTVYVQGYDINTSEKVYDEETYFANRAAVDMTVDPVTGTIYGIFWKDDDLSGYMLGKIEYLPTGPKTRKIIDLPGDWCALAADKAGNLYGVRREIEGNAVKSSAIYLFVNIEEGEVAKIGETGQQPLYQSSMTYDASADRMLWNVCPADNTGSIYEVSLTTGVATLLYALPGNEEIMGMYIPAATSSTNTPAAPTDLAFDFVKGSLEGSIGFTAPSTLFDGSALTGELSYTLTIDGTKNYDGTCTPGQKVAVPVTFDKGGKHEVSVTVSNADGKSPALKGSFTAGFATPKDPANVVMTVDGDNVTVTWDAVTAAAGEGYFDAGDVRYRLVQNPGATVVAEAMTETSYTGKLPAADGYTVYNFIVTAIMGDAESKAVKSNSYSVGTIEPPYLEDFADAASFESFTVAGTWRYDRKGYVYSSYADGNAWLFTPAIKLEGGKTYKLTFDALADMGSWDAEKLEVKMGQGTSAADMVTTVLAPFEITSESFVNYSGLLSPATDGLYHIGFHNMAVDSWGLKIDNISVEAPLDNSVPATITNLTARGDADGKLLVNISLTAPDKTFTGEALDHIDRIEVYRGTELIKTFDAPAPGAHLDYTDTTPAPGVNEYSATAYNAAGSSEKATATAFAGLDKPAMPGNLKAVEIEDGIVTVSWDKVSSGIHGGPINPDLITYDVATYINGDMDLNAMYITGNSATFRAIADGSQEYMQFVVFPIIVNGDEEIEGDPAMSEQIVVGTPSEGYRESFRGGFCLTPLAIERINKGGVALHTDADGVPSQDGDNGIIAISGNTVGASAAIASGKISLRGMVEPTLTFYTFTLTDAAAGHASRNKLEVAIAEAGGEFASELATTIDAIGAEAGWHLVSVPLGKYAGKSIVFKITAEVVNFSYTPIDNIRVGSNIDHDIAVNTLSAPVHVRAGEEYKVSVLYANLGTKAVDKFDLALYADDELLQTLPCNAIAAGGSGARQFTVTMHPLQSDDVTLQAKAILSTDGNSDNDSGAAVTVKPVVPNYPCVTDLHGTLHNSGKPVLTWSEPDYDDFALPLAKSEDMEDCEAFKPSLEGWTFVDGDGLPTGTFQNVVMPGIDKNSLQSFWIVDAASDAIPPRYSSSFAAVSGSKYLVAMYAIGGRNDDWAISPELSGEMQYVSFYAKSYSSTISEEFEVLASANGTANSDFSLVGKVASVPHSWTAYEFLLPAGTKYFAIRYCADDAMMLMIDDIRYNAAGEDERLTLAGFNIYRNGTKVNEKPVEDFEYTDAPATGSTNTYVATAVYTHGESAGSNAVTVEMSSVAEIDASQISIKAEDGAIAVYGADGQEVSVYTPDGRTVTTVTAAAETHIPVASGIYLVHTPTVTAKVIVR